jgi:integrase
MRHKGHVRERTPGSFEIRYSWIDPTTGKRRTATTTVHGPRKEADKELRRRLTALDEGTHVDPSRMTVNEWLTAWLAAVKPEVSPKTHERYGEIVRHFLIPELGTLLLQKLNPASIQSAYAKWATEGRRDGKSGGLSPRTRRHFHRILFAALNRAVEQELLAKNPAAAFKKRLPKVERKEITTLTTDEAAALLASIKHTRMYWPVLIALSTGARRGEVLALRWRNVDFDRGIVRIVESLEQTRISLRFKAPKNEKARAITLPAFAISELQRLKREQADELRTLGIRQHADTLVCRRANPFNRDGQIDVDAAIPPRSCSHEFVRLVRGVKGIPRVSFHQLRHSHASALIQSGANLKVVQERLGHSSISVTVDIYGHLAETAQQDAAARLDAAFQSAINRAAGEHH